MLALPQVWSRDRCTAAGLNLVVMLVPREELGSVRCVMAGASGKVSEERAETSANENPWKDILGSVADD